jgi:predicted DNA-binding transcriptional regulator YafY
MNRRGFLRAVGATGLLLAMQGPAAGAIFGSKQSMEDLIRRALSEKQMLKFKYHGYARMVEPYALGHTTNERLALLGWQVSGGSASEPPPGWRTFLLSDIRSLARLRKNYVPRPDYRPETTKLHPIKAEVIPEKHPTEK